MKIIAYISKNNGPAFHRLITPLLLMKDIDVFITNDLQEKHFEDKQPDIFMYNRILPEHAGPIVQQLKQKYGFKICVDIDDYWNLDEHHVLYDEYNKVGFAAQQVQHIKDADIVLTTHGRLAYEIGAFNPNVHICPNAIPHMGQFDIVREPHYLTRLFWQGSVTHREDIQILATPIQALSKLSTKIKMVMGGYTENEPEWHAMALTYTANLKHQYKLIPGTPVTNYYSHYTHADICLVPLVNTMFNRMKSNLKVLEAANLGLPVIASDVHPYKGMPLLFCKHSGDWIKHITRLVASKKRCKEAGQELKEYVDTHYDFHKINAERKQVLEYECSKINV